jgi:hypothetical protein
MAAVTDYATLSTAINDFTDEAFSSGDLDRIIGLAESAIRLYLPPNFAKQASTTLAFTTGSAALPSGYIRAISLVHTTYGGLTQRDIGAVRQLRVFDTSGIPSIYAMTGATVEVASSYTGNLTLDYEGSLTGLSSGNTTNWLVTNAPHVYLQACIAVQKFYRMDMGNFAGMQQAVGQVLNDLGFQSIVGGFGRAGLTLPGATP